MTCKPILQTLNGEKTKRPPVWVMRQAGRYLPEYQELRKQSADFVEFCLTPKRAAEATLQPLARFDLDAAILFADILLIPHAMQANLRFVTGEGPRLTPVQNAKDIIQLQDNWSLQPLLPVGETIKLVRRQLPEQKTLIGFAGSPWTVATYMIEGKGSRDKWPARIMAWQDPKGFDALIDLLVTASIEYLHMQEQAGAEVLKLFDSWADNLPPTLFERVIIEPTRKIVAGLRKKGVSCPIIGFPRGCGTLLSAYAAKTGCDAVALDQSQDAKHIDRLLPAGFPVQGNLDNAVLFTGGKFLDSEIKRVIAGFSNRPHIFNLGHGITPKTPIAHMQQLVDTIKQT